MAICCGFYDTSHINEAVSNRQGLGVQAQTTETLRQQKHGLGGQPASKKPRPGMANPLHFRLVEWLTFGQAAFLKDL